MNRLARAYLDQLDEMDRKSRKLQPIWDQLYAMFRAVPPGHRRHTEWVMNQEALDQIDRDFYQGSFWQTSPHLTHMFGRPIRIDPDAQETRLVMRSADAERVERTCPHCGRDPQDHGGY
jgi:hypothetical protein